MDKYKIAIIMDKLTVGSAPKLMGQGVRGLRKLGFKCDALVLSDITGEYSEHYEYHMGDIVPRVLYRGIDHKFPMFSFFSLHHILSFFTAPFRVKRKEYDLMVVYCQYTTFAAWALKIFCGIPYVLVVWDPSEWTLMKIYKKKWLKPLCWLLDWIAIKGSQGVIMSGEFHRKTFSKYKKPLHVLPLACEPTKRFNPYNNRQNLSFTYDRWDKGNRPKNADIVRGFGNGYKPIFDKEIRETCSSVTLHISGVHEAFGMQTLEAAGCGCCIQAVEGSGALDLFPFYDGSVSESMGKRLWKVARRYTWERYSKNLSRILNKYL